MIRARFRLPLAAFSLKVDVFLSAPVTILFGPSGAGKTSFLETLAGLRRPDEGDIRIEESVLFSSSLGIRLPPEERQIGYVPQEALLFPHLTAEGNIRYGMRSAEQVPVSLDSVTQILEIAPLLARYPQTLSGGERQRVALARALMTQPRLLLMDEPLSAVQADLRHRILPYLKRIREQFHIPIVYVTHDPGDVMALGEEVVVMEEGRVTAQGSPVTLLHQPVFLRRVLQGPLDNSFAAEVVHNKPDLGVTQVRTEKGLMLLIPNQKEDPRTSLRLGIPAEDILIAVSAPEGLSARNIFPGKIDQMEAAAGTVLLRVEALETFLVRLSGSAAENLHLHVGQTVHLIVKSHSIHLL